MFFLSSQVIPRTIPLSCVSCWKGVFIRTCPRSPVVSTQLSACSTRSTRSTRPRYRTIAGGRMGFSVTVLGTPLRGKVVYGGDYFCRNTFICICCLSMRSTFVSATGADIPDMVFNFYESYDPPGPPSLSIVTKILGRIGTGGRHTTPPLLSGAILNRRAWEILGSCSSVA